MYLSTKKLTTVLAAALLVPAGLAAQDHEAHHPEEDPPRAQDAPAKAEMMTMPCPMMGERMMMREGHGMMMGERAGMMMQDRPGMMSDMRAMQRGMDAMQPGPRMLLHQREALGLSEAQIEELERLQARHHEFRAEQRDRMSAVREQLRSLRRSDDPDLDRYESLLRERADLRVEMRLRMAETHRDAMDLLTDEQRSNVRFGMRMMEQMKDMMDRMRGGEGSMSPGSQEGRRGSDGGHHRMQPR